MPLVIGKAVFKKELLPLPIGSIDKSAATRWQRLMTRWTEANNHYLTAIEKLKTSGARGRKTQPEEDASAAVEELKQIKAEIDKMIQTSFRRRPPVTEAIVVGTVETKPLIPGAAAESERGDIKARHRDR
jgi:hypothetical protein